MMTANMYYVFEFDIEKLRKSHKCGHLGSKYLEILLFDKWASDVNNLSRPKLPIVERNLCAGRRPPDRERPW